MCITNSNAVNETFNVNIYCFATYKVKANNPYDAATIAVNSPLDLELQCEKYKVSWSENDCMMIDVNAVDGSETDEFDYASVHNAQGNLPTVNENSKLYEVDMYFNLEIEVNDAEDEDEAIELAESADVMVNTITDLDMSWCYSDSVESSVTTQ